MPKTSIAWTDRSINPIRARNRETGAVGHACVKVAPECNNCYAEAYNSRSRPNGDKLIGTSLPYVASTIDKVEFFLDDKFLLEVLRRQVPTKWFWVSMSDMFGEFVPDDMIIKCFAVMLLTQRHTHQVLTKRPERARQIMGAPNFGECVYDMAFDLSHQWLCGHLIDSVPEVDVLPNVWLGTTAGTMKTLEKNASWLIQTPAAVRWLSVEPMLEAMDLRNYLKASWMPDRIVQPGSVPVAYMPVVGLDWVVVGGESMQKKDEARPFDIEWARILRDQCKDAGVAFFMKQMGSSVINGLSDAYVNSSKPWPDGAKFDNIGRVYLKDRAGADPEEWPEDLRVREFPRKAT